MEPAPKHSDPLPPPAHVAIIMDGNGRWARERRLPNIAGHKRGAEALRNTVVAARELGIGYLTVYGFSSENWNRPASEVDDLMGLLRLYLRREIVELGKNGVRLRVIGDFSRFDKDIIDLIAYAEEQTRTNTTLHLTLALSYGGRAEIAQAARRCAELVAAGTLAVDDINEDHFAEHLFTIDLPDPDLVIRTSGEQRISNFLLWQSAYSELVFTPTLWPDFGKADLVSAIGEFHQRERRYGTTGA